MCPGLDPASLGDRIAEALAVRLGLGLLAEEEDVLGATCSKRARHRGSGPRARGAPRHRWRGPARGGRRRRLSTGSVPRRPMRCSSPSRNDSSGLTSRPQRWGRPRTSTATSRRFVTRAASPDCSMVTVDDIDLVVGGITLAMAIERFLDDADPGVRPGGDYGIEGRLDRAGRRRAARVLPSLMDRQVVALVAAYEESARIAATVSALHGLADEVVVVDDGSKDGTSSAALVAGATVLRASRRSGKGTGDRGSARTAPPRRGVAPRGRRSRRNGVSARSARRCGP